MSGLFPSANPDHASRYSTSQIQKASTEQSEALHDWCLGELKRANDETSATPGLVLAPLNDLFHDTRSWAFIQAYFVAGVDLFGHASIDAERLGHIPSALSVRGEGDGIRKKRLSREQADRESRRDLELLERKLAFVRGFGDAELLLHDAVAGGMRLDGRCQSDDQGKQPG